MIKVLTFDCYGTLIDWETGILEALKPILKDVANGEILRVYGTLEPRAERGKFKNYKTVLRMVARGFGKHFDARVPENCLVNSICDWKPFPDTVDALHRLRTRFKLAVISNTDHDIFVRTERRLGVRFDWKILSEDVKAYKPSLKNFQYALKKIGLPKEQILHVAQSAYHDIVPANRLGIKSALVDRSRHGTTPPAVARPDLTVPDLKSLCKLLLSRKEI